MRAWNRSTWRWLVRRWMMVMIKMAPTDTTTLHTEYSHADHIMTDGLSVCRGRDKLTRLFMCPALLQTHPNSVCHSFKNYHPWARRLLFFLRPTRFTHVCLSACSDKQLWIIWLSKQRATIIWTCKSPLRLQHLNDTDDAKCVWVGV